jgi:hypothetical protein
MPGSLGLRPTVCLEVIALVASSCGYYRGEIEQRVAQSCTVHVAIQRGRAKCPQHRHPPRAQPVTPRRECHGGWPRLPPRRDTAEAPHRAQGHPGGNTGTTREAQRRHRCTCLGRRGPPTAPLFAAGHGLATTRCSSEVLAMTADARHGERGRPEG